MPTSPRESAIGLPTLRGLEQGKLLAMLLDERCESPHEVRAIAGSDSAPARERRLGRRNRSVGLLDPRLLELGDRLFGGGIDDRERHPRSNSCSRS